MSVGRHRFVSAHLFLNQQPVMWTDKFRYLGVQFLCGNTIEVDVVPVKRQFYATCNSILAKSSGTCDPVKVQLVKSYCLALLMYCIGALRLKRSTAQRLCVCWNDALRKILRLSVSVSRTDLMALDRLLDLLAYRFLCFSCIFSVLVSYSYVRQTKLASSLVNFWAHNKILFD